MFWKRFSSIFNGSQAILAKQHFNLAKKIFEKTQIKIEILTGKTELKQERKYLRT